MKIYIRELCILCSFNGFMILGFNKNLFNKCLFFWIKSYDTIEEYNY